MLTLSWNTVFQPGYTYVFLAVAFVACVVGLVAGRPRVILVGFGVSMLGLAYAITGLCLAATGVIA